MNEPLITLTICGNCGEDLEVSRELAGDRLVISVTPCACKAKEMVEEITEAIEDKDKLKIKYFAPGRRAGKNYAMAMQQISQGLQEAIEIIKEKVGLS